MGRGFALSIGIFAKIASAQGLFAHSFVWRQVGGQRSQTGSA
jgi:hypothetical protein